MYSDISMRSNEEREPDTELSPALPLLLLSLSCPGEFSIVVELDGIESETLLNKKSLSALASSVFPVNGHEYKAIPVRK